MMGAVGVWSAMLIVAGAILLALGLMTPTEIVQPYTVSQGTPLSLGDVESTVVAGVIATPTEVPLYVGYPSPVLTGYVPECNDLSCR